jgi:ParB/RepB/Spo0J family partition protein
VARPTTAAPVAANAAKELPNAVNGMELRMVRVSDIIIPEDRHQRRGRRHAGALGESMKEIGLDTPISVSPADEDGKYVLVGGGGRLEQAIDQGWAEVHALVKVRDARARAASTAAENMAREELSPAEEADALELMIREGDSPQEAAKKVGLTARTGTARMPLVELPEEVRRAFHHDMLSPSLASLVKELYDGNNAVGVEIGALGVKLPAAVNAALSRSPGEFFRVLPQLHQDAKLRGKPPFIATFSRGSEHGRRISWSPKDAGRIKIKGAAGKWFAERVAETKHRWDRPEILLSEEDLDQAAALGLAYHSPGEHGSVWVHDKKWLTDHINEIVLPRMQMEAEAKKTESPLKKLRKAVSGTVNLAKLTAAELAPTLERRFKRELQPKAHDANQALGLALTTKLAVSKLTREHALFFAYETLGADTSKQNLYSDGRARKVAECAARCMPEWATVETIKQKSGKTKRKITYLDGPSAERKMWEYIKAARTGEEILARTMQFHAMALLFKRECGASGKEPYRRTPGNTIAAEQLRKLAKPHIPVEIKRLERHIRDFKPNDQAEKMIADARAEVAAKEAGSNAGGSGTVKRLNRKAQALDLVTKTPGITIPELAAKMGVKQNYLYRTLPVLETDGKLKKEGRGWHPVVATENAEPALAAAA